jgi:hypothetical protein
LGCKHADNERQGLRALVTSLRSAFRPRHRHEIFVIEAYAGALRLFLHASLTMCRMDAAPRNRVGVRSIKLSAILSG